MITKQNDSNGCENPIFELTPKNCFDKNPSNFRIKSIEFNPITKKLIIEQYPDVLISTEINQLEDVIELTHLNPVEDIVTSIPSSAANGTSYILQSGDKYYHCTWKQDLNYWNRIELKDGYEFFNKKDSVEYRYVNGGLENVSTINLTKVLDKNFIKILNSAGDGVQLDLASSNYAGLFSPEEKLKLQSIIKYISNIYLSNDDKLKLVVTSSSNDDFNTLITNKIDIREATTTKNGLMSTQMVVDLKNLYDKLENKVYSIDEINNLLNNKVDKEPGKSLIESSQIIKLSRIDSYVEDINIKSSNNTTYLTGNKKTPSTGDVIQFNIPIPNVTTLYSGLMTPEYKNILDLLKPYHYGTINKYYLPTGCQLNYTLYDPINKTSENQYLLLDIANSTNPGLMSNIDKSKLDRIISYLSDVNIGEINENNITLSFKLIDAENTNKYTIIPIKLQSATTLLSGLLSASDKDKLNNISYYITELTDTEDSTESYVSIKYKLYNPGSKTTITKNFNIQGATDKIAGVLTKENYLIIQGLKDPNGNVLTYLGTPSTTWKIGNTIIKNEKEGISIRNEDDTDYEDLIVRDLTVRGNITYQGDTYIIDAEEVKVTDNILLLNSGEKGQGVTKGISGIQVDRGSLPDYFIIFDESDDRFKCGTEGDLYPLMLRDNEENMVDGAFLTWNSTFKRAQTTSTVPIQGGIKFALQNLSESNTDLVLSREDNNLKLKYGNEVGKELSLRILDDIYFLSSSTASRYIFDKPINTSSISFSKGSEYGKEYDITIERNEDGIKYTNLNNDYTTTINPTSIDITSNDNNLKYTFDKPIEAPSFSMSDGSTFLTGDINNFKDKYFLSWDASTKKVVTTNIVHTDGLFFDKVSLVKLDYTLNNVGLKILTEQNNSLELYELNEKWNIDTTKDIFNFNKPISIPNGTRNTTNDYIAFIDPKEKLTDTYFTVWDAINEKLITSNKVPSDGLKFGDSILKPFINDKGDQGIELITNNGSIYIYDSNDNKYNITTNKDYIYLKDLMVNTIIRESDNSEVLFKNDLQNLLDGYLPLIAGSENPLTGDLYINSNQLFLQNKSVLKTFDDNTSILEIGDNHSKINLYGVIVNRTDGTNKYKIWDEGNDGHTSGLDADLLDGIQGSDFVYYLGNIADISNIEDSNIANKILSFNNNYLQTGINDIDTSSGIRVVLSNIKDNPLDYNLFSLYILNNRNIYLNSNDIYCKLWHDHNDGHESGLDADLLDGIHASSLTLKSDFDLIDIWYKEV